MPCFIRLARRLGVSIPTGLEDNVEEELKRMLSADSHQDLENLLDVYSAYEEYSRQLLEEAIRRALLKRRKRAVQELVV